MRLIAALFAAVIVISCAPAATLTPTAEETTSTAMSAVLPTGTPEPVVVDTVTGPSPTSTQSAAETQLPTPTRPLPPTLTPIPASTDTSAPSPTPTSTARPTPSLSFEEAAAKAEKIPYADLFRDNDPYIGKMVHYRGRVIQVLETDTQDRYVLRVNVTHETWGWTDTAMVHYQGRRVIEEDFIEIVAEVRGLITYDSVLGGKVTIPELIAWYAQLIAKKGEATPLPLAGSQLPTATPFVLPTFLPTATLVPTGTPVPTATPPPLPTPQTLSVGDSGTMDGLTFTVHGVRWGSDNFSTPQAGKGFLMVDVAVRNEKGEPATVSSSLMFDLVDQEGRSQKYSFYGGAVGSLSGQLGAGRTMRGELGYEVDASQTSWELIAQPELFGTGQIIFLIPAP